MLFGARDSNVMNNIKKTKVNIQIKFNRFQMITFRQIYQCIKSQTVIQ